MTLQAPVAPSDAQTDAQSEQKSTLLTGEELYHEGSPGRVELVKGEIVSLSPTGRLHGRIEGNVYYILSQHNRERDLGEVLVGETGVYTTRDPDTVRGMDVAFLSHERLAQVTSDGFLDVAPELIVEIMSPSDRWSQVLDKLKEYFAIGVQLVWVVDPSVQQIYVYHSLTDVTILTAEDELTGGHLLPDFRVAVADLLSA